MGITGLVCYGRTLKLGCETRPPENLPLETIDVKIEKGEL